MWFVAWTSVFSMAGLRAGPTRSGTSVWAGCRSVIRGLVIVFAFRVFWHCGDGGAYCCRVARALLTADGGGRLFVPWRRPLLCMNNLRDRETDRSMRGKLNAPCACAARCSPSTSTSIWCGGAHFDVPFAVFFIRRARTRGRRSQYLRARPPRSGCCLGRYHGEDGAALISASADSQSSSSSSGLVWRCSPRLTRGAGWVFFWVPSLCVCSRRFFGGRRGGRAFTRPLGGVGRFAPCYTVLHRRG